MALFSSNYSWSSLYRSPTHTRKLSQIKALSLKMPLLYVMLFHTYALISLKSIAPKPYYYFGLHKAFFPIINNHKFFTNQLFF